MDEITKGALADPGYAGKAKTVAEYVHESIVAPDAYVSNGCPGGACQKGLMPASLGQTLTEEELASIVSYLAELPASGESAAKAPSEGAPESSSKPEAVLASAPPLTEEEAGSAKQIFFERCAGCHGTLRNGATGPALTPDKTLAKGTVALSAIVFNGTPRGMPDWGKQGCSTQAQADMMARFVQNPPPTPPEMSLEQMKATWKVIVPPEQWPAEPQHQRDWQDFFAVTLRDAGEVAIIDGDTFEVVNSVKTGYAVHISRMSATGRYVYVIGRDGKASLIDLWLEKPDVVAEVKTCYDARSIESSKYKGPEGDFFDKYAVVGCYWPPHFTILDGQTLEPFKVVSTRSYTFDTEEYHPEPRVATILASHFKPEWIINVKETGQMWLGRLHRSEQPDDQDDRVRAFPARWRLGLDQALFHGRRQPVQQDRSGGRQGRGRSVWSRRRFRTPVAGPTGLIRSTGRCGALRTSVKHRSSRSARTRWPPRAGMEGRAQ